MLNLTRVEIPLVEVKVRTIGDSILVARKGAHMSFQDDRNTVRWKVHFSSAPEKVFAALNTTAGRESFWAEEADEKDGVITFRILNYEPYRGRILRCQEPHLFSLEYFGTEVTFSLASDGAAGTDLTLVATKVDESCRMEMVAGWVSVLLAMKAYVDFDVDLRNHDSARSWQQGFADN